MTQKTEPSVDTKAAVQALEYLLAAGYVSKKRLYFENFMRGIFFSIGSVVGATIVIALLVWILSLLNDVPLVGGAVENIRDSVQRR